MEGADAGPVRPAPAVHREARDYERFIRLVRYPQGLRAFFLGSPLLGSGLRVLDAGCGTGVVTLALRDALVRRGFVPGALHAFDLTPATRERFQRRLRDRGIDGVETVQADVLALASLPGAWAEYDLVVSASMLDTCREGGSWTPWPRFAAGCARTAASSSSSRGGTGSRGR